MVATMITGTSKKNSRCVAVSAEVPSVVVSENTTNDEALEADATQCTIILVF